MIRSRIATGASVLAMMLAAGGLAGCRVHTDDANGRGKNVSVDIPFGGVHVNTDQTTATDLGLPAYPGAVVLKDKNHGSADVHVGFGEWQMRVRVANYETADAQQKVVDYYRKALSSYGEVLTCEHNHPVGQPTMTSQGLTCSDDSKNVKINLQDGDTNIDIGDLQLKAGSKRHQHVVGFDKSGHGRTEFLLMVLDLPVTSSGKSD